MSTRWTNAIQLPTTFNACHLGTRSIVVKCVKSRNLSFRRTITPVPLYIFPSGRCTCRLSMTATVDEFLSFRKVKDRSDIRQVRGLKRVEEKITARALVSSSQRVQSCCLFWRCVPTTSFQFATKLFASRQFGGVAREFAATGEATDGGGAANPSSTLIRGTCHIIRNTRRACVRSSGTDERPAVGVDLAARQDSLNGARISSEKSSRGLNPREHGR